MTVKNHMLLIARRSNQSETAGTTVTAYTVGVDGETSVAANLLDQTFSPLDGQPMQPVNRDETVTVKSGDFAAMASTGRCPNPQCAAELFTAPAERANLAGRELHCVACATKFICTPLNDGETAAAAAAKGAPAKGKEQAAPMVWYKTTRGSGADTEVFTPKGWVKKTLNGKPNPAAMPKGKSEAGVEGIGEVPETAGPTTAITPSPAGDYTAEGVGNGGSSSSSSEEDTGYNGGVVVLEGPSGSSSSSSSGYSSDSGDEGGDEVAIDGNGYLIDRVGGFIDREGQPVDVPVLASPEERAAIEQAMPGGKGKVNPKGGRSAGKKGGAGGKMGRPMNAAWRGADNAIYSGIGKLATYHGFEMPGSDEQEHQSYGAPERHVHTGLKDAGFTQHTPLEFHHESGAKAILHKNEDGLVNKVHYHNPHPMHSPEDATVDEWNTDPARQALAGAQPPHGKGKHHPGTGTPGDSTVPPPGDAPPTPAITVKKQQPVPNTIAPEATPTLDITTPVTAPSITKADLDKAVLQVINGYVGLAAAAEAPPASFAPVVDALGKAGGSAATLFGPVAIDGSAMLQAAQEGPAASTVVGILNALVGSERDGGGWKTATKLIAGQVSPEVFTAWKALSHAFANSESVEQAAAEVAQAATGATPVPTPAPAANQIEGRSIAVNLTDQLDFDPRSLTLAPVCAGTMAVCATVDGRIQPLGMLKAALAKPGNEDLFRPDRLAFLHQSFVAAAESGNPFDLGFEPICATVEVTRVIDEEVNRKVEAASGTMQEGVRNDRALLVNAMQIATAGMNKGYYDNPLVNRLASELSRFRIQGADVLARQIVSETANEYVQAILTTAAGLEGLGEQARNAVADLITRAQVPGFGPQQTVASVGDPTNPTRQANGESIPLLALLPQGSAAEAAAVAHGPRPAYNATGVETAGGKVVSLFHDVGHGGLLDAG